MTKRTQSKTAASRAGRNLNYRMSRSDVRSTALETLEELIGIYGDTDPRLGPISEKGKHWSALWAIRLAGDLTYLLTGWAENHIAGAVYRRARTPNKSTFDWNSHANEHQDYEQEDGLDLTPKQFREYIATVLEASSRSRLDWRQGLSDGLVALNDGELQFFTKPSKTGSHGRAYTLRNLRLFAVLHVHVLVGTGLKKYAAEAKVADELAQSVETLRAWEKALLKYNSELRDTMLLAKKLSRHGLHDFENPVNNWPVGTRRAWEKVLLKAEELSRNGLHDFEIPANTTSRFRGTIGLSSATRRRAANTTKPTAFTRSF